MHYYYWYSSSFNGRWFLNFWMAASAIFRIGIQCFHLYDSKPHMAMHRVWKRCPVCKLGRPVLLMNQQSFSSGRPTSYPIFVLWYLSNPPRQLRYCNCHTGTNTPKFPRDCLNLGYKWGPLDQPLTHPFWVLLPRIINEPRPAESKTELLIKGASAL